MRQQIFIIYNNDTEPVVDAIYNSTFINKKVFSESFEITHDLLLDMARTSITEYFYVIKTRKELIFNKFDFSFKPDEWDKKYVHIWNNSTDVRLYNKSNVLAGAERFTDDRIRAGEVELKNIDKQIYSYPLFDIVFIGYDEWYADEHFDNLKKRFPRAVRIDNVNGILNAHKAAASLVSTDMFYVVDADAEIVEDFGFDYQPDSVDRETVHVWHSKNPVNNLEYGYGGVKLFPTNLLRMYSGSPVDFTTSVSEKFKVIPEVSNITRFNVEPFLTWRSAFRECVKLSTKMIPNQNNIETEHRLHVWCTEGSDAHFGEFSIAGANAGREYGLMFIDQPDKLALINDFSWLRDKFFND